MWIVEKLFWLCQFQCLRLFISNWYKCGLCERKINNSYWDRIYCIQDILQVIHLVYTKKTFEIMQNQIEETINFWLKKYSENFWKTKINEMYNMNWFKCFWQFFMNQSQLIRKSNEWKRIRHVIFKISTILSKIIPI